MQKISDLEQAEIIRLRLTGHSIPEIHKITGVAKTTIQRYVKSLVVPEKYQQTLKEKQGGSRERANGLRQNVLVNAQEMVGRVSKRDRLFLLLGIYWGEGSKGDLSIINSDPLLLKAFIGCALELGIRPERLMLGIRVHDGISVSKARKFWSETLEIPLTQFTHTEVIEGKKKGKLEHGMCRIRVRAGIRERLLIQTAINLVGKSIKGM